MMLSPLIKCLRSPVALLLLLLCLFGRCEAEQVAVRSQNLDCDPCIRRQDFVLRAVVHGPKTSEFWKIAVAGMKQGALDMGVQLELEDLQETFDPVAMSTQIRTIVDEYKNDRQNPSSDSSHRLDALIVTIPSSKVHDAIHYAVQSGIPVFGFNTGYKVAEELGLLGFVAQHEYNAGVLAAQEFLRLVALQDENEGMNTTTTTIQKAVFLNHEKGNDALDDRFLGFQNTLGNATNVTELVVDPATLSNNSTIQQLRAALFDDETGCSYYDVILTAGSSTISLVLQLAAQVAEEAAAEAAAANMSESPLLCVASDTNIATFDSYNTQEGHLALLQDRLAFTMPQQEYLQGVIPILMASLYATTGTAIILPLELKTHLTGPQIINKDNFPRDDRIRCAREAFPVCHPDDDPSNTLNIHGEPARCSCFDRKQIRIGGVLHGHTGDKFWNPAYLSAEQAAQSMGVILDNERFEPPPPDREIFNDKMAARIKVLCEGGVDGIFVTIPNSERIKDSIRICLQLNIPVIAINSDPQVSKELGVMQHIGQDEYRAGYYAGLKMLQAGVTQGYCIGRKGSSGSNARCQGFVDAILEEKNKGREGIHAEIVIPTRAGTFASLRLQVEEAVEKQQQQDTNNNWDNHGFLIGTTILPLFLEIQQEHPGMSLGMFDIGSSADLIFDALDDGRLLFTADQQPFLQGNLPVYLLSYYAYTGQRILDDIILTGPKFIESRPSLAQQICENNMWEVCPRIPDEDLNYLSAGWLGVGYACFGLTCLAGLICLAWIYYYRSKAVVRASQPRFLILLVFGSVICCSAIIPMSIQTDYRNTRDPFSGEDTGKNPDIDGVDAACMAVPWLYAMGFALMFSALLAKIWRVKLIYKAGQAMRRRVVGYRDVIVILVPMLLIDMIILISWQVVSPLQWEREVTDYSFDGYALESVGKCDSDSGWYFMAGIVAFHIVCLCYALVLCWQVKDIPPDLADANWVSLSVIMVFQVSIMAIPIGAMVSDEPDAFYLVRTLALFLQSFTVLCLEFLPKMYKTYKGEYNIRASTSNPFAMGRTRISGLFSSKSSSHLSLSKSPCCQAKVVSTCSSCGGDVSTTASQPKHVLHSATHNHSSTGRDTVERGPFSSREEHGSGIVLDNCTTESPPAQVKPAVCQVEPASDLVVPDDCAMGQETNKGDASTGNGANEPTPIDAEDEKDEEKSA